jgi:hypothetical protein
MSLLKLTLVPISWTRDSTPREAIAYSVYGLPSEKQTIISMRPGGWRVVRAALPEFDQGKLYPSAEEALAALKSWIEGGEKPTRTEE